MYPKRQNRIRLLAVLVLFFGLCAAALFILRFEILTWDFRNNLWAPAYLLINGQDPFRVYLLFPGTNALWSPASVGFFFFLGALPLQIATNLWLVINVVSVIALAFVYWYRKQNNLLLITLSLLLVVLSPVTISHLYFGQATIWFVIFSLAAAYFMRANRLGFAGIVLAVGLMKPQLGLLVLPGMLVGAWQVGRLRGLFRFGAGFCLATLAGLVPLWLGYPGWLDGYLNAFRLNPQWVQPTSFRILQMLFSTWGVAMWAILFLVALGLVIYLWLQSDPLTAMAYTFAVTTLVSPYLWSYDYVLLIPFFLLILVQLRRRQFVWLFCLIWILTSLGGMVIRMSTDNVDLRFAWIPWLVVLGGVFVSWLDTKPFWERNQENLNSYER